MKKILIFIIAIIWADNTEAHPHVWINAFVSFIFEKTKIHTIKLHWQFDPFFSQVLSSDFDPNNDGIFDAEETKIMEDQILTSLKDYGFFTHSIIKPQEFDLFEKADNFSATINDRELMFTFELTLNEPIDLKKGAFGLSFYDPSNYIELIIDDRKTDQANSLQEIGCGIEYREGEEIFSQSYFIIPQEIWLKC